jgi:outer membrane lipopolysaccharide assembly protein LptE/RlpB
MKSKNLIILITALMLILSGCGSSNSFDERLAGDYEILDVYNTKDFGYITISAKGLVNADGIDFSGTTTDDILLTLESESGATENFTYNIDDYKLTLTDSNHESVTYINIDIFSQYQDDNEHLKGSYIDDNSDIYMAFDSTTEGTIPGLGNISPTPFKFNTHDGIMRLEYNEDGEKSFEYLYYKNQGNSIAVRWGINDEWTNLSKAINDANILGEYSMLYETEDEELSTVFSRLILDKEQYAVLDVTECSYDVFSNNTLVLKLPDYNLPLEYHVDGLILELNEIGISNKVVLINEKKLRDESINISNITGTYSDSKLTTLLEIKSDSTASLTKGDITTEYNITASNDYIELIDKSNGEATYYKYKIEDSIMTLESPDEKDIIALKKLG